MLANSSADSFSSGDSSRWRPLGRAMGKSRDKKGQGAGQANKAKERSERERLRKHRQRNTDYCFSDADDREFEAQASVCLLVLMRQITTAVCCTALCLLSVVGEDPQAAAAVALFHLCTRYHTVEI